MKKIKMFLFILLLVIITGCGKEEMSIKINNDKSFEIVIKQVIEKAYLQSIEGFSEEKYELEMNKVINDYKTRGIKVEWQPDETYSVIVMSKKFKNIDDYTSNKDTIVNMIELFNNEEVEDDLFVQIEGKKIFYSKDKKTYFGNMQFDSSSFGLESLSESEKKLVFNFILEFEKEPLSNNADQVSEDGKVLTWIFKPGDNKKINFKFKLNNSIWSLDSITVYFIVGVIALVGIIGYLVLKKKNIFSKKSSNIINE